MKQKSRKENTYNNTKHFQQRNKISTFIRMLRTVQCTHYTIQPAFRTSKNKNKPIGHTAYISDKAPHQK